ncbi:hypothetical protein [Pontivivens insulae]|uniref:Uncharacterized protein n=1 Tax=Pontivivens insulae TaxID=1639689 RepID=A0A2R8AC19_9RHOB|nr:hypothetical protein [Pontivivens insulae]RED11068.1 hypothetical protein DFR53_3097 [Pontivivens insulae]SPF29757.1 hypothetical protein POI8812_02074 [Pontivivens insulae]
MLSENIMVGLGFAAFGIALIAILARPAPVEEVHVFNVIAMTEAPVIGVVPETETVAILPAPAPNRG